MPKLSGFAAAAILALAAGAAQAGPVQPGQEQGLGLLPHGVPDVLKHAEANPYAPPPEPACAAIDAELADLETALGPDVDAVQPTENKAAGLVGDVVRGAIPYRGWIRKLTGAEHSDKARDKAMLAGWERRGYLKGLARQKRCLLREASSEPSPLAPEIPEARSGPAGFDRRPADLEPVYRGPADAGIFGIPASDVAPPPEPQFLAPQIAPPQPLPPAAPIYAPDADLDAPAPVMPPGAR